LQTGEGGAKPGGLEQQEGAMRTRSKHWLADRIPIRSKHWFAVASLWLIGVVVLLGADGWRWT
jgi:hypothetical protein